MRGNGKASRILIAAFCLLFLLPEQAAAQRRLINYQKVSEDGFAIAREMNEIIPWIEWGGCITPERLAELQAEFNEWSDQFDKLVAHDEDLTKKKASYQVYSESKKTYETNTTQFEALLDQKAKMRADLKYLKDHVCKPKQTSYLGGGYLGGELVKNSGWVRSTEVRDATGAISNEFSDRADPMGGGLIVGYKFAPWSNRIVVSPFASFDFLNAPVNHTFANGSYLGTTANFMSTFGLKIGPLVGRGVWLYGIAGVSALNETMKINFIPLYSSRSAWVAGGTVGIGGAWQPSFLQGFGRPVSVFAEYQHTWWQDANLNTPTASPFFNYKFRREDDVVKVGFTVDFGVQPTAPAPSYPVKALPPK